MSRTLVRAYKVSILLADVIICCSAFAVDKEPESSHFTSVRREIVDKRFQKNSGSAGGLKAQIEQVRSESGAQVGSGGNARATVREQLGQPVTDKTGDQGPDYCETPGNQGKFICTKFVFHGTPVQFVASLFVGFVGGLAISIALLTAIFRWAIRP